MTELPRDISERFADAAAIGPDGAVEITLAPEDLRGALEYLGLERPEPLEYLIDLFGVDHGDELEVIYHLSMIGSPMIVRVSAKLPRRGASVQTVTDIWPGASWPEREMLEMYGIGVEGHPDPRHLLLPEGWKGFPLRKDYEYPQDHPWLRRDPLREEPAAILKKGDEQA
ncbi:MAG: NADH-quinone oxidoreductase subunit C [Acidobacteriota bacterium]|jgi:NADH-quinone oxidoreductase subunit C|nr:NADH-quinone oxidoreductase subunit C [Acidobacteriota bacterium]